MIKLSQPNVNGAHIMFSDTPMPAVDLVLGGMGYKAGHDLLTPPPQTPTLTPDLPVGICAPRYSFAICMAPSPYCACQADAGGAAFEDNLVPVIHGLISFSYDARNASIIPPCGDPNTVTSIIRMGPSRGWIDLAARCNRQRVFWTSDI